MDVEVIDQSDEKVYTFPDEQAAERWALDEQQTYTAVREATPAELAAADAAMNQE